MEKADIKDAINLYKHGVHEAYWEEDSIENVEELVKGLIVGILIDAVVKRNLV